MKHRDQVRCSLVVSSFLAGACATALLLLPLAQPHLSLPAPTTVLATAADAGPATAAVAAPATLPTPPTVAASTPATPLARGSGEVTDTPLAKRVLEAENLFTTAIKSCLGQQCIDERPPGSPVDRILIAALPGSGGEVLYRLLQQLTRAEPKTRIELVFSSRAPPYGYGRNLGFNRIVKFVARPLVNVAAAVNGWCGPNRCGWNDGEVADEIYARTMVQYLRWHCRLKTAHTKSMNVFANDLLTRPFFELEQAASFVGLKPDRGKLMDALRQEGIDPSSSALAPWAPEGGALPWPSGLEESRVRAAIEAWEEEFRRTNTLQKWPCGSVRDMSTPFLRMLLPNCTGVFGVRCFAGGDSTPGEFVT